MDLQTLLGSADQYGTSKILLLGICSVKSRYVFPDIARVIICNPHFIHIFQWHNHKQQKRKRK